MRQAGATLHRGARASLSQPLLLQSTGSSHAGSVVVAHGPSCSAATRIRGILPDQGSNLCPLHWQADSQPLRHQGSPLTHFMIYSSGLWVCLVFSLNDISHTLHLLISSSPDLGVLLRGSGLYCSRVHFSAWHIIDTQEILFLNCPPLQAKELPPCAPMTMSTSPLWYHVYFQLMNYL